MKYDFIPVDYSYFDYDGKNYIKIIGRTKHKTQICLIDDYSPNFWLILKENSQKEEIDKLIEKIKKITIEKNIRNTEITDIQIHTKKFLEKEVKAIQIFATNHKDLHEIASEIGDSEIIKHRREYDINILSKYIMEKQLNPLTWYTIEATPLTTEDFGGIINVIDLEATFRLDNFKESKEQHEFKPKVLAYDIETKSVEIGKNQIFMISLYGENFKKVLTCQNTKDRQEYVESFWTEKEMLEAFIQNIKEYSPDILCGYFSDGFDLPYIKARAEKNKLKLNIGIDNSQPTFSKGRIPTGKIDGIVHIDVFRFIQSAFSQYLQTESLSLNAVANELIGEQKEDFDFNLLDNMTEETWKKMFSYNLQDSKVTYDLFFAILPDLTEFTKIIKEPLFNISRSTMATNCENYILHNLKRFNEIAEKKPGSENIAERRMEGKYAGAFVFEPIPNLYENMVMFDFTSMYGSVIVSYNLSKATNIKDKEFSKKKGMFPTLLEEIIKKRKQYKKEYANNKNNLTKARSNAYKLLANASYGYMGFFGARYYSRESAEATTQIAKKHILETIEEIKNQGHQIIYSDTDSIAFLQEDKTKEQIMELLKTLNNNLPGIMELDFEDFYKRGLFVSKRTTSQGAKKKYALLQENGQLKIRGFETVRRDWCQLARETQKGILESILRTGNEEKALKEFERIIKELETRNIDKTQLIIQTQLKKDIKSYASKGPHVIAAEKMIKQGLSVSTGMPIKYYIGEINSKTKKIGDKVFLPQEKTKYDIDYYKNNQLIPSVENIFEIFNINIKDKLNKKSQSSLTDF